MHASTKIRLGSLKRVLPEKQETDAGKIVQAAFQEVKLGPPDMLQCYVLKRVLQNILFLVQSGYFVRLLPGDQMYVRDSLAMTLHQVCMNGKSAHKQFGLILDGNQLGILRLYFGKTNKWMLSNIRLHLYIFCTYWNIFEDTLVHIGTYFAVME